MLGLSIKQKLTNYYYFVIFNSLIVVLISIGYFYSDWKNPTHLFAVSTDIISLVSLALSHFSSITFLVLLISLVIAPCIFFKNKIYKYCLALIATLGLFYIVLDIISHYYFAFGINTLLGTLQIIHIPTEFSNIFKIIPLILVIIVYIAEYIFISKLEYYSIKPKFIYNFIYIFIITSIASYSIFYKILNQDKQNLIVYSNTLPWFYQSKQLMHKIPNYNKQKIIDNLTNILLSKKNIIKYPIKKLKTNEDIKPPNIVIIGIDSWRADYFNKINTPNLWKFAKTGKIFTNHQSSGNCTRLGLFGLFYGIPATHWREFFINKQSSVFLDRLQQLNYCCKSFIFFENNDPCGFFIKDIQSIFYGSKKNTPTETDENITKDWLTWYKNRDKSKPHFSFIWYGTAYGNDFPKKYMQKHFPTAGGYRYHDLVKKYGTDAFIGTYKAGVNYLDDLTNEIITELQEDNALNNTIVIITSDHGQDFAENRQNFWGHGTNFTDSQIKVPFAIIGSKFTNTKIDLNNNDLTTHYDLVPTLMKNFLGVTNDISDYSVGIDLLAKNTKRYCDFVTGNFKWCGIPSSDYIINFHPSGNYYITDKQNQPLFNKKVNDNILYLALKNMFKFLH